MSIWEGTTNILSLDVLRSITKTQGQTLQAFATDIQTRTSNIISTSQDPALASSVSKVNQALKDLLSFATEAGGSSAEFMEVAARDFAYSLARIYMGMLLLEHAAWMEATSVDVAVAQR